MKRLFLVWTLIFSFISVPGLALIHDVAHPFHAHLDGENHHSEWGHHSHHGDLNHQQANHLDPDHAVSGFHDALETWLCELYDLASAQFVAKCHNLAPQVVHRASAVDLPAWAAVYSPGFYPSFWGRAPPVSLI
jgi:hypothetical protein